MASERQGLLIDWGGVLTTNLFASFNAFCAEEGLEPNAIATAFRANPEARELVIGLETGTIPEQQFELRLSEMLGIEPTPLIARLMAGAAKDQAMCDAVLRARSKGIRTGLISNSWGTTRYDRAMLAEMFDGVVISGEVGLRKPAPEMYTRGAEAIGLAPAQCVFVDDLPFNLTPAAELGMATVHHTDSAQTIAELERVLGVALQ
ncbi:MAG: HAD family hydrolase [Solirubrobacteraceae bacterium]